MTKYCTFWRRIFAGILDSFVFFPIVVCLPFNFLAKLLLPPDRGPFLTIVWAVINYTAAWLYSVLLHARYGQTLGKMATRVKVLDVSEERLPTLRQTFIRDIGNIIPSMLMLAYDISIVLFGRSAKSSEFTSFFGEILFVTGISVGFLWWFLVEIISMATNKKRRALHDYIAGTIVVRCP